MTLLLDLAREVHEFAGRREPVEEWRQFCRDRVPTMRARVGDHSVTTMGRYPRRFVDAAMWCRIGGERFAHMWEAEPRSRYIDACNGGKAKARWAARDHEAMEAIRGAEIPHYRKAGTPTVPCVCIDLDAAYWSFARHFSTQVEYAPDSGSWAAVGSEWRDLPTLMRAKVLRSTICTVSWHNRFGAWYDHGERHETRSPYYQPQAYRLLSDYLMSVAQEVVALFDPWAVNNDGYVIEAHQADDLTEFLADRWAASSKVEKSWAPGEPWPWVDRHPRCAIRPVPDLVRQRLAWAMTGQGPQSGRMRAYRGDDGVLVFEVPAAEAEPPAAPWQARRGLSRWQLIVAELPARFEWRHPGQAGGRQFCRGVAGADQEPSEAEEWVEPVRGPPRTKREAPPGKGAPQTEPVPEPAKCTVPHSARERWSSPEPVPLGESLALALRGLDAARAALGPGLGRPHGLAEQVQAQGGELAPVDLGVSDGLGQAEPAAVTEG